jgi:hypothetical protein
MNPKTKAMLSSGVLIAACLAALPSFAASHREGR